MIRLHNEFRKAEIAARGAVLAVGNFDGVHMGHRVLIQETLRIARERQAPSAVMTFEPHPREFFQPGSDPFRLTLAPMKQRIFESLGIRHLFTISFDRQFSQMTGEDFVRDALVSGLGVRHIVVGTDFAFGKGRSGNAVLLQAAATDGLFGLSLIEPAVCADGEVYSSSRIRGHLRSAEFQKAEKLLGWAWEMEGEIIHGDKRGRTLGYPTANQSVLRYVRLPYGIYAVRVCIEGEGGWRNGVASFGIRPMFESPQPLLETHIFNYNTEIYGKKMRVKPLVYLRKEIKFADIASLQAQMKQDCLEAQAVLKSAA